MWKGIVGKPMTIEQFDQYVSGIFRTVGFSHFKWAKFCVVHNTQIPSFAQWHSVSGAARMKNLERYYRDTQGWSGGPHAFIADDFIWPFTPLWLPGVHAPSWNAVAWGIEIVGNYAKEPLRADVLTNTIGALSTLHRLAHFDPTTIRFHKEDPKTTHDGCPGPNVKKANIIRAVQQSLAGLPIDVADVSAVIEWRRLLKIGMQGPDVAELQGLLGMTSLQHPGKFGPLTEANVVAFQEQHGLEADGKVGDETRQVLRSNPLGG